MNHSQFSQAMYYVKNLDNSIRLYVGEHYRFNIGYPLQQALRSASNLLSNVIPVKYLLKEYYHTNNSEILVDILSHLNRLKETIEELSEIDWFDNEELTHVAYLQEETHIFFVILMDEVDEKETM